MFVVIIMKWIVVVVVEADQVSGPICFICDREFFCGGSTRLLLLLLLLLIFALFKYF